MTELEIKNLCLSNERIPIDYRTNKEKARELLNVIRYNNFNILNEYVYPLAEWVGESIMEYDNSKLYSNIKNIEYIGKEETYDLEVEDGHSLKINGIIAHNTVNLPADTTIETVDKLYRKAHEVGCKGITIYRDGSRSGVLVSNDDKDKKKNEIQTINNIIKETQAPRRPKKLECDILRFVNKGEKWIGFIGLLDEQPYEIFTGLQESFTVPAYVEKGIIKKVKWKEKDEDGVEVDNKRYDFLFKDKDGYPQEIRGLSRAFKKDYWDTAKMVSAVLRHGMPIPHVINLLDTLHIDGDFIGTWKAGVKRMLKKYIKDEISLGEGKNKCPECGEESLVFQDGCVQCMNPKCGFSKCG